MRTLTLFVFAATLTTPSGTWAQAAPKGTAGAARSSRGYFSETQADRGKQQAPGSRAGCSLSTFNC